MSTECPICKDERYYLDNINPMYDWNSYTDEGWIMKCPNCGHEGDV